MGENQRGSNEFASSVSSGLKVVFHNLAVLSLLPEASARPWGKTPASKFR